MKIQDNVAFRAYTLAQALAPFDTGNLKFNAMDLLITNDGFNIHYNSGFAHYITFLEEGTIYSVKNKNFIKHKTRGSVAGYLQTALNGDITLPTRHHKIVTEQSLRNLEAREERALESIAINNAYEVEYF